MPGWVSGVIRDAITTDIITGVHVHIFDTATDSVNTDGTGSYISSLLPMGSYNIVAHAYGYQASPVTRVNIADNQITLFDFDLFPDSTVNLYGQKSDGTWQSIASNDNNSLLTSNAADRAVRNGNSYCITTGNFTIATSAYAALRVENPLGSGKSVYLWRIFVGSYGDATFDYFRNASLAGAGTSITPRNTNFSATDSSVLTCSYLNQLTDPVIGGVLFQSFLQVWGVNTLPPEGYIILTPNTSLTIRLNNKVAAETTASMSMNYWEESL